MTDEQLVDNFRQRVATATALNDVASRVAIDIADAEAAMRIIDQQAARIAELESRIERLRGTLGLVVTSDSHRLAMALAAETLRQDDAKS